MPGKKVMREIQQTSASSAEDVCNSNLENGAPTADAIIQTPHPAKRPRVDFGEGISSQNAGNENITIDEEKENGDNEEMSELEKMVMLRKKEDAEFLESLGFSMVSTNINETFEAKPKVQKKYVSTRPKLKQTVPLLVRRSSRLQNMPPLQSESQLQVEVKSDIVECPVPAGPLSFCDASLLEDESVTATLIEDFKLIHNENIENPSHSFSWYQDNFRAMKLSSSNVVKLTPDRIVSLCIHPSSKVLVAAGDKRGRIGFWDAENHKSLCIYRPHSKFVSCLEFNPSQSSHLYSTSYDGTFRCGNLEAGIFDEVYRPVEDDGCDNLLSSFDFLATASLLIGHRSGKVVLIDHRTNNASEEVLAETPHRALKTVSIHPEKRNFITCGNEGTVCLWDLRNMKKKKKPIAEVSLPKSVSSAYFSPLTGKYILTTCMDNTLRVYNSLSSNLELKTVIRHSNMTGRWLTPFRAVWLPNVEDGFVVGSMEHPRCIEVYNINGKIIHKFIGEDLTSVCCINAFHSSRSVLVGGNSSGKVFLFVGKN